MSGLPPSTMLMRERKRVLLRLRRLIAENGEELAQSAADARKVDASEAMSSEVIPLAEAAKFLGKKAPGILRTKRYGIIGKPVWLPHRRAKVQRLPKGRVLIIGPGNYPLFLAGVQAIQAIAAGNTVKVKPAPGCEEPMNFLGILLEKSGLPAGHFSVLDTTVEAAQKAITSGVDHVVFTGSEKTGRLVAAQCAERVIPCTLELSGVDAAFVLNDADLEKTTAAIRFGLSINHGRTCVAPRRIIAESGIADRLRDELRRIPTIEWPWPTSDALKMILQYSGAKLLCGEIAEDGTIVKAPVILDGLTPEHELAQDDYFAPLALFFEANSTGEALKMDAQCPMALGASLFTNDNSKAEWIGRSGILTVNDMIAPTADPRLPFAGRGRSGYGATRGEEGLLELTRPHVVTYSKAAGEPPHLQPIDDFIKKSLPELLKMGHGSLAQRIDAMKKLVQLGRERRNPSKNE